MVSPLPRRFTGPYALGGDGYMRGREDVRRIVIAVIEVDVFWGLTK